jgi:hypothetical protein
MNTSRSEGANIMRGRFLPWPTMTYLSPLVATWPLSVLIEQPSLAAACAAVSSPPGTAGRGLRWRRGFVLRPRTIPAAVRTRERPMGGRSDKAVSIILMIARV